MSVARKWPDVYANAVNPGWVPTKMGGAGAPDSFQQGIETQVWLAISNDPESKVSGHYLHHKKPAAFLTAASEVVIQENFLALCQKVTKLELKDQ